MHAPANTHARPYTLRCIGTSKSSGEGGPAVVESLAFPVPAWDAASLYSVLGALSEEAGVVG